MGTEILESPNNNGLYKWSPGPDLPIPMKVGCITALDAAETEHLLLAERAEDGSILAASWTYNWNDVRSLFKLEQSR